MQRHPLFGLLLVTPLLVAGCSLFKLEISSGIEPLPDQTLQQRIMTREFLREYNATLDNHMETLRESDLPPERQSQLLVWQLAARQSALTAVYQTNPEAALMDFWLLLTQQRDFLDSALPRARLGEHQAGLSAMSHQLLAQFEQRSRPLLGKPDDAATFIQAMAERYPLQDARFERLPIYHDWLEWQDLDPLEAQTGYGTLPESMTDLAERVQALGEHTPKTLLWQAELLAEQSALDMETVNRLMLQMDTSLRQMHSTLEQNPEYLQSVAASLTQPLIPAAERLNQASLRLSQSLEQQRQALGEMIEREREALDRNVERHRSLLVGEVEAASDRVIEATLRQLQGVIKGLLLYIILFVLVVLFLPFGFGYWVGQRRGRSQSGKSTAAT